MSCIYNVFLPKCLALSEEMRVYYMFSTGDLSIALTKYESATTDTCLYSLDIGYCSLDEYTFIKRLFMQNGVTPQNIKTV